jgi:signal peptidase II
MSMQHGHVILKPMFRSPNRRIVTIAVFIVVLDQVTKLIVRQFLGDSQEKIIFEGFFKFVHWGNTGAAWSLFRGNNYLLALVAIAALVVLYFSRHHFEARTLAGQVAFGLICGGIVGNLIDRLLFGHVIDFIYFYLVQRGGTELGFPAFNVADSAICSGVGLVFLITWKSERGATPAESTAGE